MLVSWKTTWQICGSKHRYRHFVPLTLVENKMQWKTSTQKLNMATGKFYRASSYYFQLKSILRAIKIKLIEVLQICSASQILSFFKSLWDFIMRTLHKKHPWILSFKERKPRSRTLILKVTSIKWKIPKLLHFSESRGIRQYKNQVLILSKSPMWSFLRSQNHFNSPRVRIC